MPPIGATAGSRRTTPAIAAFNVAATAATDAAAAAATAAAAAAATAAAIPCLQVAAVPCLQVAPVKKAITLYIKAHINRAVHENVGAESRVILDLLSREFEALDEAAKLHWTGFEKIDRLRFDTETAAQP